MPKCFVVLGSTRSGTSVVTGVLHRLGVVMGWELQSEDGNPRYDWPDPWEMNPLGFFQDAPLENAQDAIWGDDYPPIGTRPTPEQAATFKELVRMRVARGHERWGFKASRTPWMMPELIESCPDQLYFVVTRRHPELSARSLKTWFSEFSDDRCREWVRRINGQIDKVLAEYDYPRFVVDFEELHDAPDATIAELAKFVGVPANHDAVSFVKPELRRVRHV